MTQPAPTIHAAAQKNPCYRAACPGGEERWLPVLGHEDIYNVSDHGRVSSRARVIERIVRGKLVRQAVPTRILSTTGRRPAVRLGTKMPRTIHTLVLEAFVGPCPPGQMCCHWDDNPRNNHIANLRWGTHSENERDKVRNGRHELASKTHCPRSHLLAPPNLHRSEWLKGHRICLACHRGRASAVHLGVVHEPGALQTISDRYYAKIMKTEETS
jgi:hypothetical protein